MTYDSRFTILKPLLIFKNNSILYYFFYVILLVGDYMNNDEIRSIIYQSKRKIKIRKRLLIGNGF